jgi:hypothetical protein
MLYPEHTSATPMNTQSPTRLQIGAALLFTAIIAFLGGLIGWYLASDTLQKDYITNILLSFCAGLLVSLVFTMIIQNILARQSAVEIFKHQQIATTTGLYERFHSPEMIEIRCRLDRLLKTIEADGPHDESFCEMHGRLYLDSPSEDDNKDWIALSSILHFYENIADLIERDLIDRDTAIANFRKYYRWLRNNPAFARAMTATETKGEQWFFLSRFRYLETTVDF